MFNPLRHPGAPAIYFLLTEKPYVPDQNTQMSIYYVPGRGGCFPWTSSRKPSSGELPSPGLPQFLTATPSVGGLIIITPTSSWETEAEDLCRGSAHVPTQVTGRAGLRTQVFRLLVGVGWRGS